MVKSTYYGAVAGFIIPFILLTTGYLPIHKENEFRTIAVLIVVGVSIGLFIKIAEILFSKYKK